MDAEASVRACESRRVKACSLKLVPWLLRGGRWKATSDLLDPDKRGLGVGCRGDDGFDSSRVAQGQIDKQDAATKINPDHSTLDLADACAFAGWMQGLR